MKQTLLLLLAVLSFNLGFAFEAPFTTSQKSYRWRNDDGTESSATWKENLNTAAVIDRVDDIIRLRIAVEETGYDTNGFINNVQNLQYRKDSNPNWTQITNDPANDFYFIPSSNELHLATTSEQFSNTFSFIGGVFISDQDPVQNVSLTSGKTTEIEYVITPSASYDSSELYYFQIPGLNGYSIYPILSANADYCATPKPVVINNQIEYNLNDVAAPISVTGTDLLWYTSATGGTGSSVVPVINTGVEGQTDYWVTQTLNSCESLRTKLSVTIYDPNAAGNSLDFDGVNDCVITSNYDTSVSDNFTIDFWVKSEKTINLPVERTSGIYGTVNQSYALFPDLPQYLGGISYDTATAGVSVGTNGVCVFEHAGNYMPSLLTWTGALTGWNRITVVYIDKQPSLYINGTFVKTGLTSVRPSVYVSARGIGGTDVPVNSGYGPFKGKIDQLYVLNKSIIPTVGCSISYNSDDIIAQYDFKHGTPNTDNTKIRFLIDSKGNANGELQNFDLTGDTSNWSADKNLGAPVVVSPVVYQLNETASPLSATSSNSGLLWYTTSTGGTGTSIAPTPSTTTLGNTSYWVSSTDVNGCEGSERSEILVDVFSTLSVETNHFETLKGMEVYPNPAKEEVNIQINEKVVVRISTILGVMVFEDSLQKGVNTIDLSKYSNGIYLIHIENNTGESKVVKLIKN